MTCSRAWTEATAFMVVATLAGACAPAASSPCTGGTCSTLASDVSMPTALALDSFNAYWADSSGTIQAVALDGGAAPRQLAQSPRTAGSIATNGVQVFWTFDPCSAPLLANGGNNSCQGGVSSVPIAGGPATTFTAEAVGIAADSSGAYWSAALGLCATDVDAGAVSVFEVDGAYYVQGDAPDATSEVPASVCGFDLSTSTVLDTVAVSDAGLMCSPALDGGAFRSLCIGEIERLGANAATPTVVAQGATPQLGPITTDDQNVYWVTDSLFTEDSDFVLKASKNGGAPIVLASGQTSPSAIATDGKRVYWQNLCNVGDFQCVNGILSVPVMGGTPTLVTPTSSDASGLAVDGTNVYWATMGDGDQNNGTIAKAPIDGGPTTVLVTGEASPIAVAVDATAVYWVNQGWGAVGTVRKRTPK